MADPTPREGESAELTSPPTRPTEVIRQQRTQQDFVVLRIAVSGLILIVLGALVGTFVLSAMEVTPPDGVMSAASAAVGALATMLVRPPVPNRDA